MDLNAQKEQFSNSFLLSIAAAAGCSVSKPSVDDDSIDWTISNRLPRKPKLDVQLKCTAVVDSADSFLAYRLTAKNYADLIPTDLIAPRILVVVLVPNDVADWLVTSEQQMILRKCAYWLSLAGESESANTSSVTVLIPAENQFTVKSLSEIMQKISAGEAL